MKQIMKHNAVQTVTNLMHFIQLCWNIVKDTRCINFTKRSVFSDNVFLVCKSANGSAPFRPIPSPDPNPNPSNPNPLGEMGGHLYKRTYDNFPLVCKSVASSATPRLRLLRHIAYKIIIWAKRNTNGYLTRFIYCLLFAANAESWFFTESLLRATVSVLWPAAAATGRRFRCWCSSVLSAACSLPHSDASRNWWLVITLYFTDGRPSLLPSVGR